MMYRMELKAKHPDDCRTYYTPTQKDLLTLLSDLAVVLDMGEDEGARIRREIENHFNASTVPKEIDIRIYPLLSGGEHATILIEKIE